MRQVPNTTERTGRELLVTLDEELDRLSQIYREPIVLSYLEGLSREEVAKRLGLPEGTVKSRLERGRKKLADALTKRGVGLGAVKVKDPAVVGVPVICAMLSMLRPGGRDPETITQP